MKPFSFRLDSVLTLREREEEAAKETYAQAVQARTRAHYALREAHAELEGYHHALSAKREGTSSRDDQLLFLSALTYQQAACQRLAGVLFLADRELEKRRLELLGAHRKVEALIHLKEKQKSEHAAESQREEESMIADLINTRYAMNLTEEGS